MTPPPPPRFPLSPFPKFDYTRRSHFQPILSYSLSSALSDFNPLVLPPLRSYAHSETHPFRLFSIIPSVCPPTLPSPPPPHPPHPSHTPLSYVHFQTHTFRLFSIIPSACPPMQWEYWMSPPPRGKYSQGKNNASFSQVPHPNLSLPPQTHTPLLTGSFSQVLHPSYPLTHNPTHKLSTHFPHPHTSTHTPIFHTFSYTPSHAHTHPLSHILTHPPSLLFTHSSLHPHPLLFIHPTLNPHPLLFIHSSLNTHPLSHTLSYSPSHPHPSHTQSVRPAAPCNIAEAVSIQVAHFEAVNVTCYCQVRVVVQLLFDTCY